MQRANAKRAPMFALDFNETVHVVGSTRQAELILAKLLRFGIRKFAAKASVVRANESLAQAQLTSRDRSGT